MSAVKKAVKGVTHAVKDVVKGTSKFVRKNWKPIVLAAGVVFTAGIATVGVAGFSSAMATADGGLGGFLSAAGSTFTAGVASIGGSLGIGNGVTAGTAGGAFADAPALASASGSGLTLGSGAAAQSLGLAPAAGAASDAAGSGVSALGHATAAGLDGAASAGVSGGTEVGLAANSGVTAAAGNSASGGGLLSTFLKSKAAGPALYAGIKGISDIEQQKAQNELYDKTKPLSYWGVGARGNSDGGGAVSGPYAAGSTLTGDTGMQASNTPQVGAAGAGASDYLFDPSAFQPNGNRPLAGLPNANAGLMGQALDANGNPIPNRYN